MAIPETSDIFVRAHTVVPRKGNRQRPSPAKWPEKVLIVDTETTIDSHQKLTFGVYRLCQLEPAGYRCTDEGLFYADSLETDQRLVLERYVNDPKNLPATEVKKFPPQMRVSLSSRSVFIERVFWKAIRNRGAMVVGFNLPFDLSRLAVKACDADNGGWSLVLSARKSRKTGEMEWNPERPRVVIKSQNSKIAFIGLKSLYRPEEWPNDGRFLDLRTLGWALRDRSYSLESACKDFSVPGKMKHKPTGHVIDEEIDYCRQDGQATASLLNAMKKEFDQHPIDLVPDKAYSPASIAKKYLDKMEIEQPRTHFDVSDKVLGIAMQGYYGGRAECRIRRTPVPVVHTDFTSQYPTVNALLGNWDVLTAEKVNFEDCTDEVRKMLEGMKLEDTFTPAFWKRLSFFALVLADKDILPVRTVYNGRTQNIGLNYLTSEQPIWYAGPDVVGSALQTGKTPHIVKAIRMLPQERQPGLTPTNLAGMVAINPQTDDFFCRVIEQKSLHKAKNKSLAHSLKIIGNSGSYGLFVEVNQEKKSKPVSVKVFSGETSFERPYSVVEKTGPWYFPPLASLITAGGRLLLAMLEQSVTEAGGSYLFCDTDSLCIVSNERGGFVPCKGDSHKFQDGRDAIKARSWDEVDAIARNFNALNPYNRSLVQDILKIEDVNFVNSDPSKPRRQVFGYAISAKRYALYTHTGNDISIVKASGHGLGYLCSPKEGVDEESGAPQWIVEAWSWLLRKELGLACVEPMWLDLPAMMRMTLTSPNVMRTHRPEWLFPFNFFFFPLVSDLGGYPAGCDRSNFRFITPFESAREKWKQLEGINLCDEQPYAMAMFPNGKQNKVIPESFRIVLRLYLGRSESKSLASDGTPCVSDTQGLLKRASVVAGEIVPVGKETDRHWEQGEDMSLLDFQVLEYRPSGKLVIADASLREEMEEQSLRKLMRRSGLSQKALYAILRGQPVRQRTLATLRRTLRF